MVFIHAQPSQTKMWSWPSHRSRVISQVAAILLFMLEEESDQGGGVRTLCPKPPPQPRSCLQLITICKEKLVFSDRVSLGIKTTLKDRLNAQQLMVNTKQSQ